MLHKMGVDGWTTDGQPAGRPQNIMSPLPIVGQGLKTKVVK